MKPPTNDFVNLSTNYGCGPHDPPKLCGSPGSNPDDCVDKAAVIFYNVPMEWTMISRPRNRRCTIRGVRKAHACSDSAEKI